MNIVHWSAAALLMAASVALMIRKTDHPLAYALGFWGALILMVTDLAAHAAWWWSTADAVVALIYVAAMMDALSDRRVTSVAAPPVAEGTKPEGPAFDCDCGACCESCGHYPDCIRFEPSEPPEGS